VRFTAHCTTINFAPRLVKPINHTYLRRAPRLPPKGSFAIVAGHLELSLNEAAALRRNVKALPTRSRILNEAERLIASRGVYGFTLQDIAGPLKVQVPAIYKHFTSRNDVLVEVARRFITTLSEQFRLPADGITDPQAQLRLVCEEFVVFHIENPAYVRLSLIDLATPRGGVEYMKQAAGGTFRANFRSGPLAPMHRRIARLIEAGCRAGVFRKVAPLDFYRVLKATLLIQLVFPDDQLLVARRGGRRTLGIQKEVLLVAVRYLSP
jgi:AcrR family transcriptional regulator